MDSPNLSLAPPGMPPQFYPHIQSRSTESHNHASRKTKRKRVEFHKGSRRIRGYERSHTEPRAEYSTRTVEAIPPPFSPSLSGNTINSNDQVPTRTTGLSRSPYASLQSRFRHSPAYDFTSPSPAPHGYNHPPTVSGRESQLPTFMYSRHLSPSAGAFWDPVHNIYAPGRHSRSLAASAGEEAPTLTLSTPITPMHARSFNSTRQRQHISQQPLQAQVPDQQPIDNNASFGDLTNSDFDLSNDALKGFDFDSFLHTGEDSGSIGGLVGFDDFTNSVEAGDGTVVVEDRRSKAAGSMSPQTKPLLHPYRSYYALGTQSRVPKRPGGGAAFERSKKKSNAAIINNSGGDMLDNFHTATAGTKRKDDLSSFPDYKPIGINSQKYLPPKIGIIKHTISEDDTVDEIRQQKSLLALQRPSVITFVPPKDWRT